MTAPLQDVTEETLAQIAKAQTSGILESTGIYSYDLSEIVSLIPVVTPWRDKVARKTSNDGNPFAVWRAMMNVTASQPDPSMGFDYAAAEVNFSEQDFQARYKPTGLAGLVTQDALDLGKGYGDPFAIATFQVLNQVLIGDDRKLLGAQSFALAQPGTVTLADVTTGGSIANSTAVYVGVAARTGSGYYYGSGNSQGRSNNLTTSTVGGGAHSVTASCAAVKGAVCYDWFVSANGTTWYYYTTTTVASVTVTSLIGANNALPTTLPDLSTSWKGIANAVPTYNGAADNGSANANDYDGLLATLSGDYNTSGQWIQPGTGTTNPAVFTDGGGAALTLSGGSVTQIENLFLAIWNAVKCSPTAIMMNAAQAQEIANLILAQPSAVTYLNTDDSGRINVTAGGRVGQVVNTPAGGTTVPIEVHTSLPPGTIIARSDRVPFPQSNISNVFEYRALRDTAQFDYGINRNPGTAGGGPRKEFEIRSVGAFINRVPPACGVLSNIS